MVDIVSDTHIILLPVVEVVGEEEEEEVVTKMWLNTAAAFTITEPSFYHTTAREDVVMSLIGFSQYISFMIYSIESASDLMTLVFFDQKAAKQCQE